MKVLAITASLALLSLSSMAQASSAFELSVLNKNLVLVDSEQSHRLINAGYRKYIGRNTSFSGYIGTSLRDTNIRTNVDTYIESLDGELITKEYVSNESIDFQYGIDVMFDYPLAKALSVYGKVGYVNTSWSSSYYPDFSDNPPSENPQGDFESGLSDCEIFGREESCGQLIGDPEGKEGDFDNIYLEAGFILYASQNARLHLGYKQSVKGGVEFDSAVIGFSMSF